MSGRGYNGEDDIGTNNNYYLYIGYWFRTMSSLEFNNRIIADIIGISSNGNPQFNWAQHLGGVQFIELCCLLLICRGWDIISDSGVNNSYYLYIGVWYRLVSPSLKWSDGNIYIAHVHNDGSTGDQLVSMTDGGVQDFHYLFFFVYERFFHDTIKESLITFSYIVFFCCWEVRKMAKICICNRWFWGKRN